MHVFPNPVTIKSIAYNNYIYIPHLLGQSWNIPQKSGTLIISVLSTGSRWCRDVRQDGCFQIIDSKVVLLQ